MDSVLNNQQLDAQEDLEGVVDMNDFSEEEDSQDNVVDMNKYADSEEDKEATWWDLAKDVIVQPALGAAKAFTWPADLLKLGMVGEALTDLDELENAFEQAGKPFSREEYIKNVAQQSQFIPTQQLLEDTFAAKTGISLEPKTKTGKWINKFFTLATLTRGAGLTKAFSAGAAGASTTAALKEAGLNETASELIGDIPAGIIGSAGKGARVFTPEVAALEKTAAKHGLPFPEYLTRETAELIGPKITDARKLSLQKELGMDSKEAIQKVIDGSLNSAQMRKAGHNLEVLYTDAYDTAKDLARKNPSPLPTQPMATRIEAEIDRIKRAAPSPSNAEKTAIQILETEKKALVDNPGNTEQLISQIQKYNQNVKGIYKKPEFSGSEDEVRKAYAILNDSIRNTIETTGDPTLRHVLSAADKIFSESSKLDKVEKLVAKAFLDGNYDPKKLSSVLNSKQGLVVRRELGDQALNEIRDIAKYGEEAVKATNQLAKSSTKLGNVAEWGPLAGFVLSKIPKAGIALGLKPAGNYIRGYLLTKPATRTVYRNIVKNAANGSFKNMRSDFAKLEEEISKDYGSVDEFVKAMVDDLELVEE